MAWVWLLHPEFGVHKVPDNPGVIPSFLGRDWQVTDLPPELDSDDPEFIELLELLRAEPEDVEPTTEAKELATDHEGIE